MAAGRVAGTASGWHVNRTALMDDMRCLLILPDELYHPDVAGGLGTAGGGAETAPNAGMTPGVPGATHCGHESKNSGCLLGGGGSSHYRCKSQGNRACLTHGTAQALSRACGLH